METGASPPIVTLATFTGKDLRRNFHPPISLLKD
jgi:hypothetical protein